MNTTSNELGSLPFDQVTYLRQLGQRLFALKQKQRGAYWQALIQSQCPDRKEGEFFRKRLSSLILRSIDLCKANNRSDPRLIEYLVMGNLPKLCSLLATIRIPRDHPLASQPGFHSRFPRKGLMPIQECVANDISKQLQFISLPLRDIAEKAVRT